MREIYLLTDYKNRFGSKHFDNPYRSGFDKEKLIFYFSKSGFNVVFLQFSDVDFNKKSFKDQIFLYTSSEDTNYEYKSYIEDIILGIHLAGGIVIPNFIYLRANNNKNFMEIVRKLKQEKCFNTLHSKCFGAYEELYAKLDIIDNVCVVKKSAGASGSGVFLAKSKKEVLKKAKLVARTRSIFEEIWEFGRSIKHKGYIKESNYRRKFILQEYIPNLKNDWKVYVFGDRYYVFYRPIFKSRGIRASGGGYDNYLYGSQANLQPGILDFAKEIFDTLDLPHVSLDIGYADGQFYLFEYQGVYFGTAGIVYSKDYFSNKDNQWIVVSENLEQEQVYVESILNYLEKKNI